MGWPTEDEIGSATRIELKASGDDWVTKISRVVAYMASYCGRSLGFDEQTLSETFDGGKYLLRVKNPPIISVTSVTDNEDDEVLSLADEEYWIYDRYIKLPRPTPSRPVAMPDTTPQRYTVIYKGGYDDEGTPLPAIATDVCAEIATRVLLRIDQQYRVYDNVDQFRDGEIRSVFVDKDKAFADQYKKLDRSGLVLWAVR